MITTEQKEDLLERAHIVATETEASANDANRIGTLFGDVINGMGDGLTEDDEDDYTDAHTLRTDKSQNLTSAEKAQALGNLGISIATGSDFDNPTPIQRAKVPTVGAILDTGVMEGYVYDVTAMNSGTTFASLEALLSSEHLNDYIPVAKRKGGMSIKFVLSFDSKYVQYRLMSSEWSTTESDWQGVDEEPTNHSDNTVKSGGVVKSLINFSNGSLKAVSDYDTATGNLQTNGTFGTTSSRHGILAVSVGEIFIITNNHSSANNMRYAFATESTSVQGENIPLVSGTSVVLINHGESDLIFIPEGCSYLLFNENAEGGTTYQFTLSKVIGSIAASTFKTGERVGDLGVDAEPYVGSKNVVESGGVALYNRFQTLNHRDNTIIKPDVLVNDGYITTSGVISLTTNGHSDVMLIPSGTEIVFTGCTVNVPYFVITDENGTVQSQSDLSTGVSVIYNYVFLNDTYIRINGHRDRFVASKNDIQPRDMNVIQLDGELTSNPFEVKIKYISYQGKNRIIKNVYADTVNHEYVTYRFDADRFLVLTEDNTIVQRRNLSSLDKNDIILINYSDTSGFYRGLLYPFVKLLFHQERIDEIVQKVDNTIVFANVACEYISDNTVSLDYVSIRYNNNTTKTVYADGTSSSHNYKTFEFNDTTPARVLVIDSNNTILTRYGTSYMQAGDVLLLQWSATTSFYRGLILDSVLHKKNERYISKYVFAQIRTNATYTSNSITCSYVSRYNIVSKSFDMVYFNQEHTQVTITFGYAVLVQYLVIDKNGELKTRRSNSYLEDGDFILLRYDTSLNRFVSGELYSDYTNYMLRELEQEYHTQKYESLGQYNSVRKAYQLCKIKFTPISAIPNNSGSFNAGEEYTGIPYSSVKEYDQYIGTQVSFETFMTAVHNPRSVLYTENVSEDNSRSAIGRTYLGSNCACYYGSVCSGLVSYAWGLPVECPTSVFGRLDIDGLIRIENRSADGVKIGDCLWTPGHNMIVTNVKRNALGLVTHVEVAEETSPKARIIERTAEEFNAFLEAGLGVQPYDILRWTKLWTNKEYTPATDFVAVMDEVPTQYNYNDAICPNYGNKANYVLGDNVVLNLSETYASDGYTQLEVYKNNTLMQTYPITGQDMVLTSLPYGTYKARLTNGSDLQSQYCQWCVVEAEVSTEVNDGVLKISFSSSNATPIAYTLTSIRGSRNMQSIAITADDVSAGFVNYSIPEGETTYTYVRVYFKTDYGVAVNHKHSWVEE